jgi:hypothetical protein
MGAMRKLFSVTAILWANFSWAATPPSEPPPQPPQGPDTFDYGSLGEDARFLERPYWTWDTGVGLCWPDMHTGTASVEMAFNFFRGFWSYTRLAVSMYGLSNVLVTPEGHFPFFFFHNSLRVMPHAGIALFIDAQTGLNSWFTRSTVGLASGLVISYNVSPRSGILLELNAPTFFSDPIRVRGAVLIGYSHSFF